MDFLIGYLIDERGEDIRVPDTFHEKRALLRALMNVRMPGSVSEEFLEIQDEFLLNETSKKNLTSVEDISQRKGKMMLWKGDITTLKVDAIVNAANSKLLGCFIPQHNCIDNVIHSAAGLQLREDCNDIMIKQGHDEKIGDAKITDAYNLPSKHVIHTVGPAISQGMKPTAREDDLLKSCYISCLDIADNNNLESLAFCAISTGVFNFPQRRAAEIAVNAVRKYLDENETSLKHVIFDVFSDEDYMIYNEILFGDNYG